MEYITIYKNEIEELNGKITKLENKINSAETQIKKDEEEYIKKQNTLDERLVTMYKTGETSYLDFMLASSNIIDFISSYYLIAEVANYDTQMLENLEQHKQKLEKSKRRSRKKSKRKHK